MRCAETSWMKPMWTLLPPKLMPMLPMRWKTSMHRESTGDIWPAFMPEGLFRQRQKENEMKIEGKQVFKAPRDRLWRLLADPETLSRRGCGCQCLKEMAEGRATMGMSAVG